MADVNIYIKWKIAKQGKAYATDSLMLSGLKYVKLSKTKVESNDGNN